MRKKVLGLVFAAGLMIAVAAPVFSGGDTAYAGGCQAFGHATRDGTPWGEATKARNAAEGPGIIAADVAGAHLFYCP